MTRFALFAALLFLPALAPSKAECAFCYTGDCYSSVICGTGCMCLKEGLDVKGRCYSVGAR